MTHIPKQRVHLAERVDQVPLWKRLIKEFEGAAARLIQFEKRVGLDVSHFT